MQTGRAFRSATRSPLFRVAIPFLAAWIVILGISACGSSEEEPQRVPNNLISQTEADKRQAAVERAFLEYWSDLQYQSWAEVAAYYLPAFRDSVGTATIIGGKKLNGSSYPQLKPKIVRLRNNGEFTTINYSLRFLDGSTELASTTWRKVGDAWQLAYDSRLDAELKQYAENKVEYALNGALPVDPAETSPQAVRAGAVAAQAQARFIEEALGDEALGA